jgi:gliding motility-associated lipoprotein GldH
MRLIVTVFMLAMVVGCDTTRVYEKNHNFDERYWLVSEQPVFEFKVDDAEAPVNVYCNLRNSISYPYSRIFVKYTLNDSSGKEIKSDMINTFLFDKKTGEPQGASGVGDIYDHQIPLLTNYTFDSSGKYSVRFEQFMRTDTLEGMLAVGLRVERAGPQ